MKTLAQGNQFRYNVSAIISYPMEQKARMTVASIKRRYSKKEFARRGDALYENEIRPHLKREDEGKFLAIDIETGAYEIGTDELKVGDRLRTRVPEAQIWMVRVGSPYVHRFNRLRL